MRPDDEDAIERLLREDARRAIADGGFSTRVARNLPPPRASAWLQPALVLGAAALGGGLAWLLAPTGVSLVQGFLDLSRFQSQTPSALVALGMALAMAVSAAVLAADES
jgi:hypothetical protein